MSEELTEKEILFLKLIQQQAKEIGQLEERIEGLLYRRAEKKK
jgi:hypothetical protein